MLKDRKDTAREIVANVLDGLQRYIADRKPKPGVDKVVRLRGIKHVERDGPPPPEALRNTDDC